MKKDELKPYEYDRLAGIPSWVKILLLKFWAAGAAFYFIEGSGLIPIHDNFTFNIIMGLFVALVWNFIVKPIVRMMRNSKDDTFRYNLINIKGAKAFIVYLIYSLLIIEPIILLCSFFVRNNLWFNLFGNDAELGIDPFLFGLMAIAIDSFCVLVKYIVIYFIKKSKAKKMI